MHKKYWEMGRNVQMRKGKEEMGKGKKRKEKKKRLEWINGNKSFVNKEMVECWREGRGSKMYRVQVQISYDGCYHYVSLYTCWPNKIKKQKKNGD